MPAPLWAILALSLALNLWGIGFGLPEGWHNDEVVHRAADMVRDRTLNPHSYLYGSMHYYVVLAVSALPYLVSKLFSADLLTQKTVIYLAARSLSALMGVGCVFLTFLLGRLLFNATSGLIAALLLALSMGFVSIAHFATVDVPMLFWMMLSFLMAGLVLRAGDRRFYVFAGLFAGLAAATKYVGGVALLTLLVAYVLRTDNRDHRGMLWGALASAAAFVVANPPLLLWSCEFLEGFIMDNAFNSAYGSGPDAVPLLRLLARFHHVMGTALWLLIGAALIYSLKLMFRAEGSRSIILIGSMFVPFLLLAVNVGYPSVRHYVPLAPPLLLLVGKMMADLLAARNPLARRASLGIGAAAVLWSGLYTLSAELQFSDDSREQATRWIEKNVRPGSTIEMTAYGPTLPNDEFAVIRRPKQHLVAGTVAALEQTAVYRLLHPLYARYKSWAETVGVCPPRERHYQGWYDAYVDQDGFDRSMAGLEQRRPDFLVVSDLYYGRYESDPTSTAGRFYADLLAGRSNYDEVATFKQGLLPWSDPQPEYINPMIRIFQRQRGDAERAAPRHSGSGVANASPRDGER